MNSKPIWFFLILLAIPSLAQNKFYLQVYQDGKASMELDEHKKAKELFEIAAFGFLDHSDLLLSCRVRLVLLASKTRNKEELKSLLIQTKSLRSKTGIKHSQIEDSLWNEYLILAGEKERGLTPSPDDQAELVPFIKENPGRLDAWKKLFSLLLKNQALLSEKSMVKNALNRFPENIFIAEMGLHMDLQSKRKRNYLSRAQKVLVLDPNNSLGHEVLGLESFRKKRRIEAREHFSHVSHSLISETNQIKIELNEWFKTQAALEMEKNEAARQKALEHKEKTVKEDRKAQSISEKEKLKESVPKQAIQPKDIEATTPVQKHVDPITTQRGLESIVKRNPSDSDARFKLVELLLNKKNLRKTKKHLSILGRIDAKDPRYLATFAHYHFLKENYKQVTDGLFGLDNLNDKAKYYLGKSYQFQKDNTQAFTILSSINDLTAFPKLREELTQIKNGLNPHYEFIQSFGTHWDNGKLDKKQKITVVLTLLNNKDGFNSTKYGRRFQKEYPKEDISQYFEARILLLKGFYLESSEVFYRLANSGFKGHEIYFFSGYAFYKSGKPFVTKYMLEKAKEQGSKFEKEIEDILAKLL